MTEYDNLSEETKLKARSKSNAKGQRHRSGLNVENKMCRNNLTDISTIIHNVPLRFGKLYYLAK